MHLEDFQDKVNILLTAWQALKNYVEQSRAHRCTSAWLVPGTRTCLYMLNWIRTTACSSNHHAMRHWGEVLVNVQWKTSVTIKTISEGLSGKQPLFSSRSSLGVWQESQSRTVSLHSAHRRDDLSYSRLLKDAVVLEEVTPLPDALVPPDNSLGFTEYTALGSVYFLHDGQYTFYMMELCGELLLFIL